VVEAPAVPVVVPLAVEPVALPVAAAPAELPPEAPLDEALPACASAKVLERAKAIANAIVVSFMVVFLGLMTKGKSPLAPMFRSPSARYKPPSRPHESTHAAVIVFHREPYLLVTAGGVHRTIGAYPPYLRR
jgi:hypothetical protein